MLNQLQLFREAAGEGPFSRFWTGAKIIFLKKNKTPAKILIVIG
jgi:hypothetical protein